MENHDKKRARKLAETLAACREHLGSEIPTQTIEVFLRVCSEPGITMTRLADVVGISQSSVSRNVAMLSKHFKPGKAGLDCVEAREDLHERRRKVVNPTAHGTAVLKKLMKQIEGRS